MTSYSWSSVTSAFFETAKAVDGLLAQMGQQGVAFPGIVSLLRDLRLTCFPLIGKSALFLESTILRDGRCLLSSS